MPPMTVLTNWPNLLPPGFQLPGGLPTIPGLSIPGQPPAGVRTVTMYMATWGGACTMLQNDLNARQIPYAKIDVDQDKAAYTQARTESNSQGIPLTLVVREAQRHWVEGADGNRIEQLYKGP